MTVLIVDDNRDAADTLAILLTACGHRVVVAYDGPTALEKAAADPPDGFVLDIGMPGMDGYEVARRLRADPATAGATLVAFTGFGDAASAAAVRAAGFDHHLVKGWDGSAEVLEVLKRGVPT